MRKLGVALGGGGLKGLAHIGVLQVLEDYRLRPVYLSGTSAGSLIAALYASGVSPYQMEEIIYNIKPEDYLDYNITGLLRYIIGCFVPGVNNTLDGIIKGSKLEKMVFRLTEGKRLTDSRLSLAIIATDIDSGLQVIFSNKDLPVDEKNTLLVKDVLMSEAVRASTSIPATFVPKVLEGHQMVDGGLRSMVPVTVQRLMGAEVVLAVNLGQETYRRQVEGIPAIVSRTLNILTYETSSTEEQLYADIIVYPEVGEVGLDDLEQAGSIIRKGRKAMKNNMQKLLQELTEQEHIKEPRHIISQNQQFRPTSDRWQGGGYNGNR